MFTLEKSVMEYPTDRGLSLFQMIINTLEHGKMAGCTVEELSLGQKVINS